MKERSIWGYLEESGNILRIPKGHQTILSSTNGTWKGIQDFNEVENGAKNFKKDTVPSDSRTETVCNNLHLPMEIDWRFS